MSKNYIETGEAVVLTAPYATASGEGALVANTFGVALTDVANGETGPYAVEGVWELPKTASDTIDQGQVVYWDAAAKTVTETATSNYKIGFAVEASAEADTTVVVKLDGRAILQEPGA